MTLGKSLILFLLFSFEEWRLKKKSVSVPGLTQGLNQTADTTFTLSMVNGHTCPLPWLCSHCTELAAALQRSSVAERCHSPFLSMRALWHREAKRLAWGHTANEWQSQDAQPRVSLLCATLTASQVRGCDLMSVGI